MDNELELSIARHYPEFKLTYMAKTPDDRRQVVKNSDEFISFYFLLQSYLPDVPRYQKAASSSLKGHAMKGNFILPPFFFGRKGADELAYYP